VGNEALAALGVEVIVSMQHSITLRLATKSIIKGNEVLNVVSRLKAWLILIAWLMVDICSENLMHKVTLGVRKSWRVIKIALAHTAREFNKNTTPHSHLMAIEVYLTLAPNSGEDSRINSLTNTTCPFSGCRTIILSSLPACQTPIKHCLG